MLISTLVADRDDELGRLGDSFNQMASQIEQAIAARIRSVQLEEENRRVIEANRLKSGFSSTAKKHPGTGLGLALTKRIVEAQGGRVGVSSTSGKGSTFFAVLPQTGTAVDAGGSRG